MDEQQRDNADTLQFLLVTLSEGSAERAYDRVSTHIQRSASVQATLPRRIDGIRQFDGKQALEKAGIVFLGDCEDNTLLQKVSFPDGWKKVPTTNSLWTSLVDDQDRVRASIMYSNLPWDRDARVDVLRRFGTTDDFDRRMNDNVAVGQVTDCGKVFHSIDPIPYTEDEERYQTTDRARLAAEQWLDGNFPNWRDPGAYWD